MKTFSKKLILILVVLIIAFIALGAWLGTALTEKGGQSEYSAVFLSTGDVYFGKLSRFPKTILSDTWFLQRGVDAEGTQQLSIVPMRSVFWGPVDKIELNPENIIFSARLAEGSEVIKALTNPQGAPPLPTGEAHREEVKVPSVEL